MTKYPDEGLFNGIKTFQKDNGLTKDGVMKPGGETDTALRQSLDARAQQPTSEIPSDPGQDDPDEPDDITPRPPGDQHPPEKPEKPDEDDGKDKRPATGPCSDLYFKSLEANQALDEARQQVWANNQEKENTAQEIAELKAEHIKENADNLILPDRIQDTRKSSPINAATSLGRRSIPGLIVTGAQVAKKAYEDTEHSEKIAELEVKLTALRTEQTRLEDVEEKVKADSDEVGRILRECEARYK